LLVGLGSALGEGEVLAAAALAEGADELEGERVAVVVEVASADPLGLGVGAGVGEGGTDGDSEGCRGLLEVDVQVGVGVGVSAPEPDPLGGAEAESELLADGTAVPVDVADAAAVPLPVGEGSSVRVPEAVGSAVPLVVAVVEALAPAEREEVAEADSEAVELSVDEAEAEDELVALGDCKPRGEDHGTGDMDGAGGHNLGRRVAAEASRRSAGHKYRAVTHRSSRAFARLSLAANAALSPLSVHSPQCPLRTLIAWTSLMRTRSAQEHDAATRNIGGAAAMQEGGPVGHPRHRPSVSCRRRVSCRAQRSALTSLLDGVIVPEAVADTELVAVALSLGEALCAGGARGEVQARYR
jgi:hypothetical protein